MKSLANGICSPLIWVIFNWLLHEKSGERDLFTPDLGNF